MTDYISRADALMELNGACSNWEDDAKVAEIINALPSADTESDDLIIKGAKGIKDGLYNITEARGKWIPLGHQIGFLKHPWSEDYQCSLCGYEAYTIGTPPPKVCPQCHANNIIDKANDVIKERNEVIE